TETDLINEYPPLGNCGIAASLKEAAVARGTLVRNNSKSAFRCYTNSSERRSLGNCRSPVFDESTADRERPGLVVTHAANNNISLLAVELHRLFPHPISDSPKCGFAVHNAQNCPLKLAPTIP
ncbi:hypothetical protein, partial [Sphingomonas sp. PAMC 26617]|uniref:hypothetical protein n=1 Tax=Sphingomonas sp. PAMC 26617 TaxID=1112216 RepID=UPI001E49B3E9